MRINNWKIPGVFCAIFMLAVLKSFCAWDGFCPNLPDKPDPRDFQYSCLSEQDCLFGYITNYKVIEAGKLLCIEGCKSSKEDRQACYDRCDKNHKNSFCANLAVYQNCMLTHPCPSPTPTTKPSGTPTKTGTPVAKPSPSPTPR